MRGGKEDMIKELRSDFETRQFLLARDYELFY